MVVSEDIDPFYFQILASLVLLITKTAVLTGVHSTFHQPIMIGTIMRETEIDCFGGLNLRIVGDLTGDLMEILGV